MMHTGADGTNALFSLCRLDFLVSPSTALAMAWKLALCGFPKQRVDAPLGRRAIENSYLNDGSGVNYRRH